MLTSRMFFSDWAYRARIKSPVELAVGAALAMGGKVSTDFLRDSCTRLGQNLLNPPNVKGWPGDKTWINANTVLLRFNFAMQMATQRQQEFVRKSELDEWLKDERHQDGRRRHRSLRGAAARRAAAERGARQFLDYMNRDEKDEAKAVQADRRDDQHRKCAACAHDDDDAGVPARVNELFRAENRLCNRHDVKCCEWDWAGWA